MAVSRGRKKRFYGQPTPAEEEPFLAGILADPAEDDPRLVFADWLEDRGDPRAQFIRVQCQLAKLSLTDPDRIPLERQEAALLKKHASQWIKHFPNARGMGWGIAHKLVDSTFRGRQYFSRGMLSIATPKSFHDFRNYADYLADETLVDKLSFVSALRPNQLAEALATRVGARLKGLALSSPILNVGDEGAVVLAGSPAAASLEILNLYGNNILDAGLAYLLPHLRRVTHLDLTYNELGREGIERLAHWKGLKKVAVLAIDLDRSTASRFLLSPNLGGLVSFALKGMETTPIVGQVLASPKLRKLRRLQIEPERLTPAQLKPLAQMTQLEHFGIGTMTVDVELVEAIASLRSLREVNLRLTPAAKVALKQARPDLKIMQYPV